MIEAPPPLDARPKLLTADEVADLLRVNPSWVYRAAREGTIPSIKLGRYRRFDSHQLATFLESTGAGLR
jgi:excisionase family DNA binding protein